MKCAKKKYSTSRSYSISDFDVNNSFTVRAVLTFIAFI